MSCGLALTPKAHCIYSGNWSVDLQAGSEFGYKLLFVVLLSGIMAVVFQVGPCVAPNLKCDCS